MTPLVNSDGRVLSVVAQGRDMSSQLEAERMKKEFTSTLSHELRTPLTSIIGSLQLVNSGAIAEVEKDILELTVIAERNGQRLLDLINDLLDVEKIRAGKFDIRPERLAIDDVLNEALVLNRAFAERYGVKLRSTHSLPAAQVVADRKRLLQVLTNLISNAAKFSPEGETVQVALAKHGDRVRVEVQDRGPGIPEEFRARIFSRFAQADSAAARQKGGTGLGLAICKRLIELMNGQIGFQDRPERRHHFLVRDSDAGRLADSETEGELMPTRPLDRSSLRRGRRGHSAHRAHVARACRQDVGRDRERLAGGHRADEGVQA